MTILQELFAHKRLEITRRKLEKPLAELKADIRRAPTPIDFCQALSNRTHPALIAEIKRRSPSKGLLSADFDAERLARIYQENGAAAISILTDEHFFGGSLDILSQVAERMMDREQTRIPLLQKDFIYEAYQVYEARCHGADAILLITACLDELALRELHALAFELGMAALVEVNNAAELQKALSIQPRIIGINNRDLRDFSVHMETIDTLRPTVPAGILLVAESGIHTLADVHHLEEIGVDAILVGEALVTAGDTAAQVRLLSQVEVLE